MAKQDDRVISSLAAICLAKSSTHKKIIKLYTNIDASTLNMYHVPKHPRGWDHRDSELWTKSHDAVFAVRAHRLFIRLFAKNPDYSLPLRAIDLWEWYQTYSTLYPEDEVTANRLHYIVQMLREGKLRIKSDENACEKCGNSYVVHRELYAYKACPICRRVESVLGTVGR